MEQVLRPHVSVTSGSEGVVLIPCQVCIDIMIPPISCMIHKSTCIIIRMASIGTPKLLAYRSLKHLVLLNGIWLIFLLSLDGASKATTDSITASRTADRILEKSSHGVRVTSVRRVAISPRFGHHHLGGSAIQCSIAAFHAGIGLTSGLLGSGLLG